MSVRSTAFLINIDVLQALFHRQSGLQRYRADLAISYMEIYKDEVYDLLVNRDNVRMN